jgi:glycosyltransferase involved in cell wall biosynthesis
MALRLLFVHNGNETFVKQDRALLASQYVVHDWYQRSRAFDPVRLAQTVKASDLVFCWFASWHALTPVLLARRYNKPAIVVVGGYDTARVPEAGYGSQRGGLPRIVSRLIIRQATHLIANSQAARREAITNAGADPDKITTIYHGVEPLPMGAPEERERIALTIGGVWQENLLRKGLLPFVQAAALLPDVRFIHAGKWHDDSIETLRHAAPPNVEFRGFVTEPELAELCARASVYVQASLHEGFGLSVAEAMTAGCVPVVTAAGALPEVVGDIGVVIDEVSPRAIVAGIRHTLDVPPGMRLAARQHVIQQFPMTRREQELYKLVKGSAAVR